MSTDISTVFSLNNQRFFFIGLCFAVAPLWLVQYLPMVDLPQHAGQIAALHQLWQDNPQFDEVFQVNWFTPYLLGYLLLYGVNLVVPMTVATKIVVSLAVLSIPLSTAAVLREIGAEERLKWLAIPAGFSFAFYWGFLSYMVAVPLGLLLLVLTIRFERKPSLRAGLFIALYTTLLFFCHVLVLIFSCALALAYLLGANFREPAKFLRLSLPYATPVPLILLWSTLVVGKESALSDAPVVYGALTERVSVLLTQASGMDGFAIGVSLIVSGLVVAYPLLGKMRFSKDPRRWLPLVVGMAIFFATPSYAQGTAFLFQRSGIFLIPLWLMVWDRPDNESNAWQWLPLAAVAIWASVNIVRFTVYDRETRDFDDVLALMEPGKTAASMIVEKSSRHFSYPIYLHFSSWYQARRNGIVDFNFAAFHPQMVRYRPGKQSAIGEQVSWQPGLFRWDEHDGAGYDYFIVYSGIDVSEPLFKDRRDAVKLIARSGWWWLYEGRDPDPSPPVTPTNPVPAK